MEQARKSNYKKFLVLIDGANIVWSGYVYATSEDLAFKLAVDVAEGLGAERSDIIMCYPV